MLGLDQQYGKDVVTCYLTSYQTKGSKPTTEYLEMIRQIHDKLLDDDPTRTYRDVVNKFMHLIVRCKPKPKEQCVFTASGGKILYNSKSVKGCSVNRVYLSDLKNEEEKEKPKKKHIHTTTKKQQHNKHTKNKHRRTNNRRTKSLGEK